MKLKQIEVGGIYLARVNRAIVPVKVLAVEEFHRSTPRPHGSWCVRWKCRNTVTGRAIVVRSAQRFRSEVKAATPKVPKCVYCNDSGIHPDDPTGQADCGYCGGRR